MNISGIRPSQGFYDYNYIKLNELRGQKIAESMQAQAEISVQEPVDREMDSHVREQNYTSYNYAKEYRPDETFDMIGVDSDIHSLDVQKAVSDLEKDQIIRQYQYFVNDSGITGLVEKNKNPQEVIRRSGENFML